MNTVLLTGIMVYQFILSGISNMQPKYDDQLKIDLARVIVTAGQKYDIDPVLMYKIIAVESHFKFISINKSGDYSMTQINCRVWRKEFKRMKRKLHCGRLIGDYRYSIEKMAEILSIIKMRHPNESDWFGRYHSGTPRLKRKYLSKLRNID